MEAEKGNLRRAFQMHFRATKELHKISPKLFPVITLYAIVFGLLPYVTVFFSARILQELAVLRRPGVLWKWVSAGVLCTGAFAVLKAFLYQRRETLFDDLYGRKELLFVRKMFSLDYADMDKQETHDLRAQIRQNENWSRWGLMQTPEAYESSLKGIVGIFSGIALTVSLFTSPVPETAGALTVLNHPVFIAVLAALILFITFLAANSISRPYPIGAAGQKRPPWETGCSVSLALSEQRKTAMRIFGCITNRIWYLPIGLKITRSVLTANWAGWPVGLLVFMRGLA